MPNLIHSLDASNIHLIIPKLKNIPIIQFMIALQPQLIIWYY